MYCKCVKFHKNPISGLGGVALTRYMDGRTDGQGDSYISPQTLFAGGIITISYIGTLFKFLLIQDSGFSGFGLNRCDCILLNDMNDLYNYY